MGKTRARSMNSCDLFILTGELSGDAHAAKIVQILQQEAPHLQITGVLGPKTRALGIPCIMPMEDLQVMGFTDVFLSLPKLLKIFFSTRKKLLQIRPKVLLTIDYPGFNLRMIRSLKKKGLSTKCIHYICPTVWAWGKQRIPLMERYLHQLLTILPFEQGLFNPEKIQVHYVGNPLIEQLLSVSNKNKKYDMTLFPGSRLKEIKRNFPLQLQAIKKVLPKNARVAISVAHPNLLPYISSMIKDINLPQNLEIHTDNPQLLMLQTAFALATSGTITLELALYRVPTIVTYFIKPIDQFVAQKLLKINLPYYALPNIIAQKEVFPELFGSNLTLHSLTSTLQTCYGNLEKQGQIQKRCMTLLQTIGDRHPSRQVAHTLIDTISHISSSSYSDLK